MAAVVQLTSPRNRARALHWLNIAEDGVIVRFLKPTRTNAQNAKMWAMLGDISKQCELHGKKHIPEMWKAIFMKACGQEVQFVLGLDSEPFPVGFRSSQMSVGQMGDLITFMLQWGDETGVKWTDEK